MVDPQRTFYNSNCGQYPSVWARSCGARAQVRKGQERARSSESPVSFKRLWCAGAVEKQIKSFSSQSSCPITGGQRLPALPGPASRRDFRQGSGDEHRAGTLQSPY